MWFLVAALVAVLVSVTAAAFMLFAGKNKKPTDDFKSVEVPTTEIGKTIPVLFGTRLIKNPSVATWGDVKVLKIKIAAGGKK